MLLPRYMMLFPRYMMLLSRYMMLFQRYMMLLPRYMMLLSMYSYTQLNASVNARNLYSTIIIYYIHDTVNRNRQALASLSIHQETLL